GASHRPPRPGHDPAGSPAPTPPGFPDAPGALGPPPDPIMSQLQMRLSNLRLIPNLVHPEYQRIFSRLSTIELYDIHRRNPSLPISFDPSRFEGLTPRQQDEWRQRLFWGDRLVSLYEENRGIDWLEHYAGGVFPALPASLADLDDEAM